MGGRATSHGGLTFYASCSFRMGKKDDYSQKENDSSLRLIAFLCSRVKIGNILPSILGSSLYMLILICGTSKLPVGRSTGLFSG